MKTLLGIAVLVFGAAGAAQGQEPVPNRETGCNVATAFSGSATDSFAANLPSNFGLHPGTSIGTTTAAVEAEPEAAPSPVPEPRFVFGGRDDFRWQLGIGADWIRFRSSIFNASAVGIKSSVTYFTNEWFAVEGNVSAAFAPQIFDQEHVKVLVYGVGPKIAWRERRWEPWAHAIVGGSHEQPQTAGHSKNAFAAELGGGADYRFNPRFSGRLEANWIHTSFFSQSQNNFELMGGVVFHF
jgi:opacity protein-like surface antigen